MDYQYTLATYVGQLKNMPRTLERIIGAIAASCCFPLAKGGRGVELSPPRDRNFSP